MPAQSHSEYEPSNLGLQEQVLASAMLGKIGGVVTNFAVNDGIRVHQGPKFEANDFHELVTTFKKDPKESLAWARESLFEIAKDDRLSEDEKQDRLGRYLDAYFDLTLKLDHEAFPVSKPGEIHSGVPDYVPDGFVDMGGDSDASEDRLGREMILINKRGILDKYKPFIQNLFTQKTGVMPTEERKLRLFKQIAQEVYFSMPYDSQDLGGGKIDINDVNSPVCRHHALVFQVLAQTLGLKSRLLKSHVSWGDSERLGRHSTNMVRLDSRWYILDATSPDFDKKGGKKKWKPALFPVDGPPMPGERKEWNVKGHYGGDKRKYVAHDDMYWFIDKPSQAYAVPMAKPARNIPTEPTVIPIRPHARPQARATVITHKQAEPQKRSASKRRVSNRRTR